MYRCHFIKEPIGNIYDYNWEATLFDRPCTNQTCHCHIGYVHLEYLKMNQVFGSGILERIPDKWVYQARMPSVDILDNLHQH